MQLKRGFVLFLVFVFSVSCVAALTNVNVTLIDSGGITRVVLLDAEDLYGYEINLDTTGEISNVVYTSFLGDDTSTGNIAQDSDTISIYESRMDSGGVGYSNVGGSDTLFTFNHTSDVELGDAWFVTNDTSSDDFETYINYRPDPTPTPDPTPDPDSSGTGGGSAAAPTLTAEQLANVDISVDPEILMATVFVDFENKKNIEVTNNGPDAITLELEVDELDEVVKMDRTRIVLQPGESKILELTIGINTRGIKVGTLNLLFKVSGKVIKTIPIILNPLSENFLFDVSLSVTEDYKVVREGDKLKAQIDLLQVGPQQKVDVLASYVIRDLSGTTYFEESETFFVLGEKSFVKEFSTKGLPPGRYIVGMEIVYPGAFASSSSQFDINPWEFSMWMIYPLLGVFVGVFVIAIVWASTRGRKHKRKRK